MPAVASTDSANPADLASDVSSSSNPITATDRLRTARRRRSPARHRRQRDQAHRGRPQDAGLRSGEDDEHDDRHQPDHGQPASPHADQPRERQDEREQQGEVRPRDGGQMSQPGRLEVVGRGRPIGRTRRPSRVRAPARVRRPARPATDSRRPARTCSAARNHHGGSSTIRGGDRIESIAATSDPRSTASSRPFASTCCAVPDVLPLGRPDDEHRRTYAGHGPSRTAPPRSSPSPPRTAGAGCPDFAVPMDRRRSSAGRDRRTLRRQAGDGPARRPSTCSPAANPIPATTTSTPTTAQPTCVRRSPGSSVGRSPGSTIRRSLGRSVGRSPGRSRCRSPGSSVRRSPGRSRCRSMGSSRCGRWHRGGVEARTRRRLLVRWPR